MVTRSSTRRAVKALTIILGGPILGLLAIVLSPIPSFILEPFSRVRTPDFGVAAEHYIRKTVRIPSVQGALSIEAWQYEPKDWLRTGAPPPIVIMAHGLGAQRDFGLHATADYFARAGAAVIAFDYRTFGGSDGEPRNWASPSRQLEDWRAVIQYATSGETHHPWDASKLVLWGTSYSGGHVLTLAAELKDRVKVVVSQVPYLSSAAAAKISLKYRGVVQSLRLLLTGWADKLGAKLGLDMPLYVTLGGLHNTMSVLSLTPEELDAWRSKHPDVKLGGWRNQILARFAAETTTYSPFNVLHEVTAPALLIGAQRDTLCPTDVIVQAALKLGGRPLIYDIDHFGLYSGNVFKDAMQKQWEFICAHINMDCSRGLAGDEPPLPPPGKETPAPGDGASSAEGEEPEPVAATT